MQFLWHNHQHKTDVLYLIKMLHNIIKVIIDLSMNSKFTVVFWLLT